MLAGKHARNESGFLNAAIAFELNVGDGAGRAFTGNLSGHTRYASRADEADSGEAK